MQEVLLLFPAEPSQEGTSLNTHREHNTKHVGATDFGAGRRDCNISVWPLYSETQGAAV